MKELGEIFNSVTPLVDSVESGRCAAAEISRALSPRAVFFLPCNKPCEHPPLHAQKMRPLFLSCFPGWHEASGAAVLQGKSSSR